MGKCFQMERSPPCQMLEAQSEDFSLTVVISRRDDLVHLGHICM